MTVFAVGILMWFCELMMSFRQSIQKKIQLLYGNYKINRRYSKKFKNNFYRLIRFHMEVRKLSEALF